ncbi:MAG: anthranilate synthase component I [Gemmatimonadales bacterium]|nr:MAG: anthranilate synthase component I [Gemmatimonadales bacterium]
MDLVPDFPEFCELAADAGVVPVRAEFLFDTETAVTAYHKLARPPFGFLLESFLGGEKWARYTFVGTEPAHAWRLRHGRAQWWSRGEGWTELEVEDPLTDLDERLQARRPAEVAGLPRFWGGAVGYFGYDVIRVIERLPDLARRDLDLPDAQVVFTDVVLAIDNLLGRAMAIRAVEVEPGLSTEELRRRYDETRRRLAGVVETLHTSPPPAALSLRREPGEDPPITSSMEREAFEAAVERIREYILAGDAFQVVLSQRLGIELASSPFELYRALRSLNPSPYLFFLEMDGVTLVGASPEVLTRVEGGTITVRPIAGTRRRGATADEDMALARELAADEKELAEHRMLVDLGRNDVGRVARYGSVRVPELMAVERYSHVMHLCSQVEGDLRPGLSAMDVLRACFPAGTVSGAPKIRAMEIIEELEPVRRGPYAGAVGYLGYGGLNMDTAIAIRTVLVHQGRAFVQAGAGVVADSDPGREYEETLNKARALLRAAAMAAPADTPPEDTPPE